ncbi:hypothetical protein ETR14_03640 [Sphingosinicella sp. BN140058]|nr:hypothetical protein ETR14_03640 [Sphingosinicella sp. BN140058]
MTLFASATPSAHAESFGYNLSLTVATHCTVSHSPVGAGAGNGGEIVLGQIAEYCNAPGGYDVIVSYTPGTLRGAVLAAGEDRVVLNGSGEAVLSHEVGPRKRERMLLAVPGEAGFDTSMLQLRLQAA